MNAVIIICSLCVVAWMLIAFLFWCLCRMASETDRRMGCDK